MPYCTQFQPTGLDQGDDFGAALQLQAQGAVVGDLRLQREPAGQGQAHEVVAPVAGDVLHRAVKLVAGAGAQHQAAEQVEVTAVFGGFEDLGLEGLQALIETQHPFAFSRQLGATAALAADAALHQGLLREVVQLVDGVPGSLVTQPRTFRGAGDGTLFGDMLQQGDTLRAADDVLGQQDGQGHGADFGQRGYWARCLSVLSTSSRRKPNAVSVGAGLLAMATARSPQGSRAYSLASQAPTGFVV